MQFVVLFKYKTNYIRRHSPMPNRRMITGNLFEDPFIGQLSSIERLLWIGLITAVADDQGRMLDHADLLRAKIFPFDLAEVSAAQVENGLVKLAQAKRITRYAAADGTHLIQIIKWWRHQTPAWAAPSLYPAPAEWQDRVKFHAGGGKVVMFEWDGCGGYVAGYVGRYVSANAADYVPEVHIPINDVNDKDKVKLEGDGEGEVSGPLGVKAPGPVAPPAPPVGVDLRVNPGRTHRYAPTDAPPAPPQPAAPPPPPPHVPMRDVVFENPVGRDVVCQLARWAAIPNIQVDAIDRNLAVLTTRYPKKAELLNYCQRFADEFYRRYPARTSAGWLDWAVMGNIPPAPQNKNRYGTRGRTDPGPVYPPRQHMSEAELAECVAILAGK
jgi:hypothetical protein